MILNFDSAIRWMESPVINDFILPFFLLFVVLYAILRKIKLFDKNKFQVVISLMLSLLVVVPHYTGRYPYGSDPISIIQNSVPSVAVIIIAIIMLFILLGLFFPDKEFKGATASGYVAIAAIAAIVWIFGSAAGWWTGWSSVERLLGNEVISFVIVVLVFGLVIRAIVTEKPANNGETMVKNLGKFFGKE